MTDNYRTMIDRIADEVGDDAVENQVKRAIRSAIKKWERKRFYFNTSTSLSFATVADREYYDADDLAAIPNLITIDWMTVDIDGTKSPVTVRDIRDLERDQFGGNKGDPYWFAYAAQTIRLQPIPQAVRTITMGAHFRLADLVGDTDTNAWMTDGEELIRLEAKVILARDVHKDDAEVVRLAPWLEQAADALFAETRRRASNDILRPPAMPVERHGFNIYRGS